MVAGGMWMGVIKGMYGVYKVMKSSQVEYGPQTYENGENH